MCIYFHSCFVRGEDKGERERETETFLPPAVALHVIIDLHQQYNPVQAFIYHQERQLNKHTESIVGNEMMKMKYCVNTVLHTVVNQRHPTALNHNVSLALC